MDFESVAKLFIASRSQGQTQDLMNLTELLRRTYNDGAKASTSLPGFEDHLKELCSHYKDDRIAPGIQLAYLPDKELFYASVHQFPGNITTRRIVSKALEKTAGEAIIKCMEIWRSIIAQPNASGS